MPLLQQLRWASLRLPPIREWNPLKMRSKQRLAPHPQGHGGAVRGLHAHPHTGLLVSGGFDKAIRVWGGEGLRSEGGGATAEEGGKGALPPLMQARLGLDSMAL